MEHKGSRREPAETGEGAREDHGVGCWEPVRWVKLRRAGCPWLPSRDHPADWVPSQSHFPSPWASQLLVAAAREEIKGI